MDALRRSIEGADNSKAKAATASAKKTEVPADQSARLPRANRGRQVAARNQGTYLQDLTLAD